MQKKGVDKLSRVLTGLKTIGAVIGILGSLLFLVFTGLILIAVIGLFVGEPLPTTQGNVAVVPLEGVISTAGSEDFFGAKGTSRQVVEQINSAEENENIKAIILEINSPGGSPVATDEIVQAIKESKKYTVAVIREQGASGAFWIATAADKIVANRMSVVGSIGATSSFLQFSGLLNKYNVSYERLVAGKYKDAGSRYRDMTPEERALFQSLLDKLHEYFIQDVAENRKLPVESVRQLATGFVFLGEEAKDLRLVDVLGGRKEAIELIEKELSIKAELVEYTPRKSLVEFFSQVQSNYAFNLGKGIGDALSSPKPALA